MIEINQNIENLLKNMAANEGGPDNYDMTAKQIKDLILDNYELGKPVYPSDIADDHGLDYDAVLEAIDMLRKEHRIKDEA